MINKVKVLTVLSKVLPTQLVKKMLGITSPSREYAKHSADNVKHFPTLFGNTSKRSKVSEVTGNQITCRLVYIHPDDHAAYCEGKSVSCNHKKTRWYSIGIYPDKSRLMWSNDKPVAIKGVTK